MDGPLLRAEYGVIRMLTRIYPGQAANGVKDVSIGPVKCRAGVVYLGSQIAEMTAPWWAQAMLYASARHLNLSSGDDTGANEVSDRDREFCCLEEGF